MVFVSVEKAPSKSISFQPRAGASNLTVLMEVVLVFLQKILPFSNMHIDLELHFFCAKMLLAVVRLVTIGPPIPQESGDNRSSFFIQG
jgi:hypothetical protein